MASLGNHLYVLGELSGTIYQYTWSEQAWEARHATAPVAPAPWCAAIHPHPTAPFLYLSERSGNPVCLVFDDQPTAY